MVEHPDLAIALPTIINLCFAFAMGACAGSFIHVVAFRMPAGLSVIVPPSRCPTCGFRLRWHHNLPIVGYLLVRGRCAACADRIPPRYVLSEVAAGLLAAGLYALLFLPAPGTFWYPVGEGWWGAQGVAAALPAVLVVFWAIGSLAAMAACDARTFLIPVAIPWWASAVAFVGWPLAAAVARGTNHPFPVPSVSWPLAVASVAALGGLAVSRFLLAAGILPRSFADWDEFADDEGDVFADYPFARREMIKEVAFVGPAALLGTCGWFAAQAFPAPASLDPSVSAFFSVAAGFVIGGAVVWALRIVATVLLDTEALGMGDVHLLSAAGAAFGWRVALVGFVVAPFLGLAWWLANLVRKAPMRMPFGPSLAAGAFAGFALRPVLATVVGGALAGIAELGIRARTEPGGALALSAVLAVGGIIAARAARRAGGPVAAISLALVLCAVVAWILAAPARPYFGAVVGLGLAVACGGGSLVCGSSLEEQPGPRTALARILRLLAAVVVLIGLFLFLVRSGPPIPDTGSGFQ